MADFLKTFSILALVFALGCSGKSGFEPDDFPTYVEQDGVTLKIEVSDSPTIRPITYFAIPEDGWVTLTLHNITDYRIKFLVDENLTAGSYSIRFDMTNEAGEQVKDGLYLIRLNFQGMIVLELLYFRTLAFFRDPLD